MSEIKITLKGIVKYQDKYLLIKKWYDDRIGEPYQWGFIDGYGEIGKSPDDSVEELIGEKTSLSISQKKILYTWSYQVGDVSYLGISYLCETEDDMVILSEDLSGYEWVEIDNFKEYIQNEDILRDALKALKTVE